MLWIIAVILFLVAVAVLGVLIGRHYQQLTVLDPSGLPEEKMSQKKDEFLRKRAEQQGSKRRGQQVGWFKPLGRRLRIVQLHFRQIVQNVERRLLELGHQRRLKGPRTVEEEQALRTLLQDGLNAAEVHDWNNTEKKLIAAIRLDERNVTAYRALAGAYFAQDQFEEAKQTYRFVLYLDPRDDSALLRLAEIAEHEGKLDAAVEHYQQAVLINDHVAVRFAKLADLLTQLKQPATALEAIQQAVILEPQNPKYLDNFIEASILSEDKNLAEEGYRQLRTVNPDNQKLAAFRERIDSLGTK